MELPVKQNNNDRKSPDILTLIPDMMKNREREKEIINQFSSERKTEFNQPENKQEICSFGIEKVCDRKRLRTQHAIELGERKTKESWNALLANDERKNPFSSLHFHIFRNRKFPIQLPLKSYQNFVLFATSTN